MCGPTAYPDGVSRTMNSDDPVLLDYEDDTEIATVTLNEPDRYNPWSRPIVEGMKDALAEAEEMDPRCLVVQGAGDAFSAGGDIDLMERTIEEDIQPHDKVRMIENDNPAINGVFRFPAPTVAKVDGPAAGVGANLAIACDVILASDRSIVSFAFRNVGLNVDGGTSGLLPRIVGINIAKELTFTGEVVEAERAKELGIFNHVYPEAEFEERAREMVEDIASGPSVALRYTKDLINSANTKTLEQAQYDEAVAQAAVVKTDDHEAGVRAFLDDHDPEFTGE